MCWTGPFEFRWLKGYVYNPSYYHHQIGSIHLSHCCHIFPWLCVWDGCTTIFCHLLHIYLGNTGTLFQLFVFSLLMFSLWYLQMIGYIMACRSCLFVCILHHTISLSSLCRFIWRHWTNKMFVRYILPSVCLRLRLFSQLSFIQYMGLCVFSLPNSSVIIVRMCTLSYYHHQIGSMNHKPLFRVRSWNNGMRCMYYYVLMFLWNCVSGKHILKCPQNGGHYIQGLMC